MIMLPIVKVVQDIANGADSFHDILLHSPWYYESVLRLTRDLILSLVPNPCFVASPVVITAI